MKNYYKAVRIAKSYAGEWYRDVVHGAYLTYWDQFGKNLFDAHEGTVLRYVRNQYGNFYRTYYKSHRLKHRDVLEYDDRDIRNPHFEFIYSQLPQPTKEDIFGPVYHITKAKKAYFK